MLWQYGVTKVIGDKSTVVGFYTIPLKNVLCNQLTFKCLLEYEGFDLLIKQGNVMPIGNILVKKLRKHSYKLKGAGILVVLAF